MEIDIWLGLWIVGGCVAAWLAWKWMSEAK